MSEFLTSTELLLNCKDIPPYDPKKNFWEQEPETLAFWLEEDHKIRHGVTIGGYFIHPWLYWDICVYKAPIPMKNLGEVIMSPPLDDNMLYMIENYADAEENNKHLAIFGARGTRKSTMIASHSTWKTYIKNNGVMSINGSSTADLNEVSRLIQMHFTHVHPAFKIPTIINKWTSQVTLGVKETASETLLHSFIKITNNDTEKTKSTEKGAGGSPIGYIYDEIGKGDFFKSFESAIPSFTTQFGNKLVAILAGTAGNDKLSNDAKKLLSNPEAFGVLPMNFDRLDRLTDPEEITWNKSRTTKFGTFFPGQMSYRMDVPKVQKSLAEVIGIESKDLEKIKINVTNWKVANEWIAREVNSKPDEESKSRSKMYFPREIDDVWITKGRNPFPKAVIARHIARLKERGSTGKPVEIFKHEGKYHMEFSDKAFAPTYYDGQEADAPIRLYGKLPLEEPPKFKNVGGLDSYKLSGQAADGSLGALYILQRANTEVNQPCEIILASYAARPNKQKDFDKTCEIAVRAFNADTCLEAIDISFQTHMEGEGLADDYLCRAFSLAVTKDKKRGNVSLRTPYGLYPSEQNNIVRMKHFINWSHQEFVMGLDEEGKPITKLAVEFIEDIDLLQEMYDYHPGGNYDRIAAYSHALIHAHQLDKEEVNPIISNKEQLDKLANIRKANPPRKYNKFGNRRSRPF